MHFLKQHWDTEGPLGFPVTDKVARALDAICKTLPEGKEYAYRKTVVARAPTELNPGERSDVSWISTESPDRECEVVLARGMNDGQFAANPLVTLGHSYALPPVGKSLWRKRVKDGDRVGIKAKTVYPARPDSWPASDPWPSDRVLSLIQAGLLQGKSIGFLPLKVHVPRDRERETNPGWQNVQLVIDEWLLLEYACVFLPANQDALVETVSKGDLALSDEFLQALGLNRNLFDQHQPAPAAAAVIPFTPLDEIARALARRLGHIDPVRLVEERLDRARGRV